MKRDNLLDYVPRHNSLHTYTKNEKGNVELRVENRGFFNGVAQKFFGTPRYSSIELVGLGSFVWETIDGKRTVYDIGQLVKEKYGDEAELLYERLAEYIKTLHKLGYIVYENKK